jgi:hypothetical protein
MTTRPTSEVLIERLHPGTGDRDTRSERTRQRAIELPGLQQRGEMSQGNRCHNFRLIFASREGEYTQLGESDQEAKIRLQQRQVFEVGTVSSFKR